MTASSGKVTVTYHSAEAVRQAYSRESSSLPVRVDNQSAVVFFPEDDETLTARCTPRQAEYLTTIPGFSAPGYELAEVPAVTVRNWHRHGEDIVARNQGQIQEQAKANPQGLLESLFASSPELTAALSQAIAARVAGALPPVAAAPVVTHNIDLYEMMDLVEADEAAELVSEFDEAFDMGRATRSAVYTRLVRLADDNAIVFERLNRRRAPLSEA